MIFHHAELHTNIAPSNLLLQSQETQRFSEITDFRFSSEKGLYPCDMNYQSMETIVNFIQKYDVPIEKRSFLSKYFK